ncbi:unnamed protein product, partial [Adineta steineri]
FNDNIEDGFNYYNKALEFAEQIEKHEPSGIHKYQLVNAIFQWAKARVRCDRLTDITERKFRRAIELYKQVNDENNKNSLRIIGELAILYIKTCLNNVMLHNILF